YRFRWRTIGIVGTIYVVQVIVKIVSLAAPGWEWLSAFTALSAYEPCGFIMQASFDWPSAWHVLQTNPQGDILNLGPLGYDLLLLGIGGAFYLAAAIVFSRRDLPAPL